MPIPYQSHNVTKYKAKHTSGWRSLRYRVGCGSGTARRRTSPAPRARRRDCSALIQRTCSQTQGSSRSYVLYTALLGNTRHLTVRHLTVRNLSLHLSKLELHTYLMWLRRFEELRLRYLIIRVTFDYTLTQGVTLEKARRLITGLHSDT